MRAICLAAIISLFASLSFAQSDSGEDKKDPNRERLGLRAGYVGTTSGLDNVFGGGLDLSLHWVQRIKYPFALDFTVGAFYLGSTGREDITIQTFGQLFDNVSMRVIHITAAPMLEFGLGERTDLYVSAGGGLYTVSLLIDQAFAETDLTNSHFGVVLGSGVIRQISHNWFVDANFTLNKFWTSKESDDLFFHYSEGDNNPVFYAISVGVMLRLF
jgi:opacity protein-like surface antigen